MTNLSRKIFIIGGLLLSFVTSFFFVPMEVYAQRATTPGAACVNNANCMAGEYCNTGTGFCGPIVTPTPSIVTPTLTEGPAITPTPYTGGANPPSGFGNVTTPGYCGGDPNLVWDNAAKMCFPKGEQCTEGSLACSKSLSDLIIKIINYLLIFAGMIAVLAVIVGGFWYITAAGNEEQAEKGKKAIINSIIGIVVITLAFLIIRVISHTLTSGSV
jgi:hypothetical protein